MKKNENFDDDDCEPCKIIDSDGEIDDITPNSSYSGEEVEKQFSTDDCVNVIEKDLKATDE